MKKLVLTALFTSIVASMATGCIITSGDSPNTITASWTLLSGDDNALSACPAGADTVALLSQDSFGEVYTDLFDCTRGVGTSSDLPAGPYLAWLQLTDFSGNTLYAQSLSTEVNVVEDGDSSLAFQFSVDRGAFTMAWDVYEAGLQSSCENVGAVNFSMTITDPNNNLFAEDKFPCTNYEGSTAGLATFAPWTMSPAILDAGDLALAVGDTITDSLAYGNEYRDLGLIILDTAAP